MRAMEAEFHRLKLNEGYLLRLANPKPARGFSKRGAMLLQEYSVYSQCGEDGILQYILSVIGATTKRCVEIGVEDGRMCNTANLIINHGWTALLVDSNDKHVVAGRCHYGSQPTVSPGQVQFLEAFVTAENVNQLLEACQFTDPLDLLSIDIDGNDYWVWSAIDIVQPSVVVIEYNAALGTRLSVAVRYDATARYQSYPDSYDWGASLRALARLGETKGYCLVACSSSGANAFFVRSNLLAPPLLRMEVEEAYYPLAPQYCLPSSGEERRFHLEAFAVVG
jgi:hypothetical protein